MQSEDMHLLWEKYGMLLKDKFLEDRSAAMWRDSNELPPDFFYKNPTYTDWIIRSYIRNGIILYGDIRTRVHPALDAYTSLPAKDQKPLDTFCGIVGCKHSITGQKVPGLEVEQMFPPEVLGNIFSHLDWRTRHKALAVTKNTGLNWLSWRDVPSNRLFKQLEKMLTENKSIDQLANWCDRYNIKLRLRVDWDTWKGLSSSELTRLMSVWQELPIKAMEPNPMDGWLYMAASHNKPHHMIWLIENFGHIYSHWILRVALQEALEHGYYELIYLFANHYEQLFDNNFKFDDWFGIAIKNGNIAAAKWMVNRYPEQVEKLAKAGHVTKWLSWALKKNDLKMAKFIHTLEPEPGRENPFYTMCFIEIVENGNIDAAEWFVSTHPWIISLDWLSRNEDIFTIAADHEHDHMVQWLKEKFQVQ